MTARGWPGGLQPGFALHLVKLVVGHVVHAALWCGVDVRMAVPAAGGRGAAGSD